MIDARGITVRAGGRALLRDVSVGLRAGEVLAVVGPNGAGKSTLLRALAGELRPAAGTIAVAGRPVRDWPPLGLARRRAVVSQSVALAFPMAVADVVALSRLPWHGTPQAARDGAAVAAAMARVGVAHLAGRAYPNLSGGERQRVQITRGLAQLDGAVRPAALLLDEPTASLDTAHRAALLNGLRGLAAEGAAVLAVLHDLNEAAFGPPAEALHPAAVEAVYGLPFRAVPGGGLLPDLSAAAGGSPPARYKESASWP